MTSDIACFADMPALGDYYDIDGKRIDKLGVMVELMGNPDYGVVGTHELAFHGRLLRIDTRWIGNDPGYQPLERSYGWRPYGPRVFESAVFADGNLFHGVRYATVRGARDGHDFLVRYFRSLGGQFMLPKAPLMLEGPR